MNKVLLLLVVLKFILILQMLGRLCWEVDNKRKMSANEKKAKLTENDDAKSSHIHKRTEFDGVLEKVNSFSRFQWMQWFLLFVAVVPQAWYTYAPAFAARKVKNSPSKQMMYCKGDPYRNTSVCNAWGKSNGNSSCSQVVYTTDFTSVVTEVSHFKVIIPSQR